MSSVTYDVVIDRFPPGVPTDNKYVQCGITEENLPALRKQVDDWNTEAAENEATGMPTELALILGLPLGHVSIVSSDTGEPIA